MFGVEILVDCFNHEVALRKVGELGRGREATDGRFTLFTAHAALLDRAAEPAVDGIPCAPTHILRDLISDDVQSSLDADLGDTGSHRAQTDDADSPDLHRPIL